MLRKTQNTVAVKYSIRAEGVVLRASMVRDSGLGSDTAEKGEEPPPPPPPPLLKRDVRSRESILSSVKRDVRVRESILSTLCQFYIHSVLLSSLLHFEVSQNVSQTLKSRRNKCVYFQN